MIQLNKREKKMLMILAALAGIMLVYYLVISPIISIKQNADSTLENNISRIAKLDEIYSEYKEVQVQKNQLNIDAESSGITAIIDEASTSLNIASNKVYSRDYPGINKNGIQLISTDVKFEGISIRNIIEFVYKIENSGAPVKIKSLTISAGIKGRNRYDAVMTILSLTKR